MSPVDNVIGKYYPRCTIDVKFGKETTFKVSVLLTAGSEGQQLSRNDNKLSTLILSAQARQIIGENGVETK